MLKLLMRMLPPIVALASFASLAAAPRPGAAATLQPGDLLIMDSGTTIPVPVPETFEGQIVHIPVSPGGSPGAPLIYVSQQDVIDTGVVVPPDEGTPLTVRFTENGMALDAAGDLYFGESARDAIFVRRAAGGPLDVLATELDILGVTGGIDAKPEHMATAPGNRLFFSEAASDSLMEADTLTGALSIIATEGDFETALSNALGVPITDVDLDSGLVHRNGTIYVADSANAAVFAVAADTGAITVIATGADFAPFQPNGAIQPPVQLDGFMTADASGDLILVDDYDDEGLFQIFRIDAAGGGVALFLGQSELEDADATGDDGIVNLDGGIAFDLEGNFLVAQEDGDTVLQFPLDPAGSPGVDVLGNAGFEYLNLDDALGGGRDAEILGGLLVVVPEPGTVTLTLAGIALLALGRRLRSPAHGS